MQYYMPRTQYHVIYFIFNIISADLFQSSSVLAYSCNPPMPSNPASPKPSNSDTHQGTQASKHPSIPACMDPFFDHLKGASLICHRGPQGFRPRAPSTPPWP